MLSFLAGYTACCNDGPYLLDSLPIHTTRIFIDLNTLAKSKESFSKKVSKDSDSHGNRWQAGISTDLSNDALSFVDCSCDEDGIIAVSCVSIASIKHANDIFVG